MLPLWVWTRREGTGGGALVVVIQLQLSLVHTARWSLTAVKQGKKMRNLAGNDVSLFLFRFELRGAGIDFVLNEVIAADMYQDLEAQLKPLVHACCATLLRYRHLSLSQIIMDGNFLVSGEFEVMLSQGLGRYFEPQEKARLFQDAKQIAALLDMVMHRRTQAEKAGRPQPPAAIDHVPRA